MLTPAVLEKTNHDKDFIRKKALTCLEQIALKSPEAVDQVVEQCLQSLGDKDPGVVFCSVTCLTSILKKYPLIEVPIFEGIFQIQRQILDKKLPTEYNVMRIPAPWGQVVLLRIMRILNKRQIIPKDMELDIIFLLTETLEQPILEENTMIHAVIFECKSY